MWTFIKKWLQYVSDGLTRQVITETFYYFLNSYVIAPAGLVTATAAVNTGASVSIFQVAGTVVSKAASQAFPALTGLNLATGQTGCALFGIDASGTLYTFVSPVVIASATSLAGLQWPVPSDSQPILIVGGVIIQDVSAGAFTGGSTSLATAGLTVTYFNTPAGVNPGLPVSIR